MNKKKEGQVKRAYGRGGGEKRKKKALTKEEKNWVRKKLKNSLAGSGLSKKK